MNVDDVVSRLSRNTTAELATSEGITLIANGGTTPPVAPSSYGGDPGVLKMMEEEMAIGVAGLAKEAGPIGRSSPRGKQAVIYIYYMPPHPHLVRQEQDRIGLLMQLEQLPQYSALLAVVRHPISAVITPVAFCWAPGSIPGWMQPTPMPSMSPMITTTESISRRRQGLG